MKFDYRSFGVKMAILGFAVIATLMMSITGYIATFIAAYLVQSMEEG